MDKIPLLVEGLSLTMMLNPNVSDDIFHCTPNALSTGSLSKCNPFTCVARSDSGKDLSTCFEFDSHLVSLPPRARSCCNWSARAIAAPSLETDFNPFLTGPVQEQTAHIS